MLHRHERVEILCHDREVMGRARVALDAHGVRHDRLHVVPTDRVWLRDSAPTGVVIDAGRCRAGELGVQRVGEVRQLAATSKWAASWRAIAGLVTPRACPPRHR